MNKVLVVNVNWIGDVIFSAPVFTALKGAYPRARISCLAVPRVAEVLAGISAIDDIIVYDEQGRHRNPFAKLRLIHQLRVQRFDAAFLLHRSLTRALLVYLAGIPRRIGYDAKGRRIFLTHIVRPSPVTEHRSDHYLRVVEDYGVAVRDRHYQLTVSQEAEQAVEKILRGHDIQEEDFLVIIHPGGNWPLKRWSSKNFELLAGRLMEQGNIKVVFTGAEGDRPFINAILSRLADKPLVLAGKINLKQLAALMKRADAVVSADSGPLHIASAAGTMVIGLFGPTRPEITGPRGPGQSFVLQKDVGCNRQACYHLKCPDNICMQAVTVEDVLEIIRQIRH